MITKTLPSRLLNSYGMACQFWRLWSILGNYGVPELAIEAVAWLWAGGCLSEVPGAGEAVFRCRGVLTARLPVDKFRRPGGGLGVLVRRRMRRGG